MKQKLFSWIYPPFLVTILLTAAALTAFTSRETAKFFFELSSIELRDTAQMTANAIRPLLDSTETANETIGRVCNDLVQGTSLRLTVIDQNGRVIADTGTVPERMDFHLDREEVREAFSAGSGSAVRKSLSTGIDTTYEAIAFRDYSGQKTFVLRASMPFSIIGVRRRELALTILLFGVCLAAAVSILALFLARRLARPILRIHSGAREFSAGNLGERIPEDGPLEISNLANVMNGMAADLDARIRIIREQKNQAEAILNGITESIAVVDGDLAIRGKNPAFVKLFGNGNETSLLALTRNTELCDFMEAAIRSDGPLETSMTLYGETPRQLRLTSAPLEGGKAVLVINDLTHLNRLETVRRDFTANVSHELRTPITAIKGALETLKDEGFTDHDLSGHFLEIAIKGTDRIEAIIGDLMTLARVEEEERNGLETETVSLDAVIDSASADIAARMEAASIRLERVGDTDLSVNGHAGLLKQAIFNLLDNALKYGADGGVIRIITATKNGRAVISVQDEGSGIPERDRARIFERFYRVDKARSRESGGTGLGLSIVKHIAIAHSGSVRLESSGEKGATFSIILPLAIL